MTDFLQAVLEAHKHSSKHRAEIESSAVCGCFHCLATFEPSEIDRWIEREQTAMCPHCDIDAVMGSASGFPVDSSFLKRMRAYWFKRAVRS